MKLLLSLLPAVLSAAPITLAPGETGYQTFSLSHGNPETTKLVAVFNAEAVGQTVEAAVAGMAIPGLPVALGTQQANGGAPYPVGLAECVLAAPVTGSVTVRVTAGATAVVLRELHVSAYGQIGPSVWQSVGGNPTSSLAVEPIISPVVINNPEPGTAFLVACGSIWLLVRKRS
jgi:hypothetical protein